MGKEWSDFNPQQTRSYDLGYRLWCKVSSKLSNNIVQRLCISGKESKSSDDATPQQPSLSASALLKEHERTMKASSGKKHSQETSCDAEVADRRLTDTSSVTASIPPVEGSDGVPSGAVESKSVRDTAVKEPQLAQNHSRSSKHAEQEPARTAKQVVKPQDSLPELGRGLNVSCNGVVDLDDIPCSASPSNLTCDSVKVR